MSKNTIDKAHIQQNLARKLWKQVMRHFHKPSDHPINDASIVAIEHDLALIDENLDTSTPQKTTEPNNNKDYTEFEVEITLDELQDALALLEQQSQKMVSADDTLKQLIDTLKKSEKTAPSPQEGEKKSEMEVVVEFIPLPSPANVSLQPKAIYREIQTESVSDKLKKEKEQRELAKKITHYPPSDRLH